MYLRIMVLATVSRAFIIDFEVFRYMMIGLYFVVGCVLKFFIVIVGFFDYFMCLYDSKVCLV